MEGNSKKGRNPFYELNKVASATECTGLTPSLPLNEDEDESYAGLYATHDQPVTEDGPKPGPPICNRSVKNPR